MREISDTWKLCLIVVWCVMLVSGYVATTILMADIMRAAKVDAVERHKKRMDPKEVEDGLTKTDETIFGVPENIKVSSGIYVDRIFDVDLRRSRWKVDFYIWFKWVGPNVNPGDNFHIINGEIIDIERKKKLPADAEVDEKHAEQGEKHYELYRITAEITKFFNITRYPRDDHYMTILIEDNERLFFDLTYEPDVKGSQISSRVKIPGYKIYEHKFVEKRHSYKTRRGDPELPEVFKPAYSQLAFGIGIERVSWGLYLKMFVGIFLAVFFAQLAFFVSPSHTSPRFSIGVGAFFACIASIYVISSQIPLSGGYTLTDFVTTSSVITVFLTLLTSTISVAIYHNWNDGRAWAWWLDRTAQIIFVVCYVLLNISLVVNASR